MPLFTEESSAEVLAKQPKRARPVKKGVCWCCNSLKWLYHHSTVVGMKLECAKCCREFGCKPGFTTDGIKLRGPFSG